MYRTRPATKEERAQMQLTLPSPLGHIVTGFDSQFRAAIETMSEVQAAKLERVLFIRRRQPNGKFEYRAIEER